MCPRNSDPRQTTYTYDENGNQESAGSRTFTYDLADRLISTTGSGTTTTYAYDGNSRRVSAAVPGGNDIRYIWDPLAVSGIPELVLERDPSGALIRRYIGGPSGTVSMANGSGTFYYHRDPIGTVTDVTDSSGAPQWKYEYDAFGDERSATDVSGTAPENPLRFTDQYLDSDTGLYHLGARQYDPTTGRFSGLDPVETPLSDPSVGAYVYVNDRPTVLVDPTGCVVDSGGLPYCTHTHIHKNGAKISVQVSFHYYLHWGIYMDNYLYDYGPWWVSVWVNGRLWDTKMPPRQVYPPHGRLKPAQATRGGVFFINFVHNSFGKWWSGYLTCRIP